MERTSEEIITNEPFVVCFGEKKFKIKRLTIAKAKAWRTQVIEHDNGLAARFSQDNIQERLTALSESGPDLVMDLVQNFIDAQTGDKVTREQIEEATDEQLLGAYREFLEVTFPNGTLNAATTILHRVLSSTLPM